MKMISKQSVVACLWLVVLLPQGAFAAGQVSTSTPVDSGFVANKQSVQVVFNALSSKMGKPIILSRQATKKQVSGTFDLASPWLALDRLTDQLSLIWYFDGQSVYVYDAGETKNSVVSLHNIDRNTLIAFLTSSGLYDKRYPLKGGAGSGPFYVSGPPVYVDIIVNTAAYMLISTRSVSAFLLNRSSDLSVDTGMRVLTVRMSAKSSGRSGPWAKKRRESM